MKNILSMGLLFLGFSASAFALDQNALPASVSLVHVGTRELLANRAGLTAYVFDVDSPGVSNCYNACANAWPAILVLGNDQPAAPFGVTVRKDGTKQVTLNNRPIYTYAGDGQTGDTNGDGLGGVWHVIPQ